MTSLIVVLAYLGFMVVLSVLCARRSRGNASFFRGSGKTPWYVVAIAMISTSISGVTFVSVPGMVAASGFGYLQMVAGFVLGYVVIAFVLLPLYYKLRLSSLYEYLGRRFGFWSYKSGAVLFLLSKLLGCGVRLYLTAIVLQLVLFGPLGVPFWLNVLLTIIVVWAYTAKGGVGSIVWTDMLQTLVLLGTVVVTIVLIGKNMGLGFSGIVESIADSGMSRVWFFDDWRDTRYFWKQFLAGVFTTIAMTGLDQDMMQKNLSCKSLKDSQKNVLSYGVAFLPVNFLFLCLGVLLYLFAQSSGLAIGKSDELFAQVSCGGLMPPVIGVLFTLGIVSASFSSAGSALTALTTSFTLDILGFSSKIKAADERKLSKTRRWVHAGVAALMVGVICAFKWIGSDSVVDVVYKLVGYTYGPLLGLFFFGMASKRSVRDGWVPVICVLSPLICLLLSLNSAEWLWGYKIGFELLLINAALTMLGLLLASKPRCS